MEILKRPGVSTLDELVQQRLSIINSREVDIPILNEVKAFIDNAILIENRPMYIFTDYDVDGITSCVCAVKLFKTVYPDARIIYRTPRRLSEGYGFSMKVLPEVPEGALLVTIDNGIAAFDPLRAAKEKGCKIVVLDHHLGAESGSLPEADYIVDPNAIKDQAEFTGYCGCGLIYKLSQKYDLNEFLKKELRGLAALATVADCVPLREENWRIAHDLTHAMFNCGINDMINRYAIEDFDEGDAGFKICPTLNAPGRLEDDGARKSVEYLLGEDELLDELVSLNEERKHMTEDLMNQAVALIEKENKVNDNAICLIMDAPEGLVGILAGRIAEKYQCPAIVFARTEGGNIKGSARTYGGNHLKNMLDKCSDLLLKYGGHAAAAGLSLSEANFDEFSERMCSLAEKDTDENIYYDIELSPYYVQRSIMEALNTLSEIRPFGESNEEPLFYIPNVRLFPVGGKTYKTMGSENQHVKLFGKDFDILYFGGADKYLEHPYDRVNVVGKISENRFNGKSSYQIEAVYIEEAKRELRKSRFQAALDKRAAERI